MSVYVCILLFYMLHTVDYLERLASSLVREYSGKETDFLSVRTYNIQTGHLILEHNYPRQKPPLEPPSVAVDINAVLETVTSEELSVGAWVNVLGYVRRNRRSDDDDSAVSQSNPNPVYVEAVMLFPAGAVALGEYERILQEALGVERRMRRTG